MFAFTRFSALLLVLVFQFDAVFAIGSTTQGWNPPPDTEVIDYLASYTPAPLPTPGPNDDHNLSGSYCQAQSTSYQADITAWRQYVFMGSSSAWLSMSPNATFSKTTHIETIRGPAAYTYTATSNAPGHWGNDSNWTPGTPTATYTYTQADMTTSYSVYSYEETMTPWPPTYSCSHCSETCTIYAPEVQLIYFPAEEPSNGTITSAASPATAVVDGYTFSSPSVYLSFPTIWALDDCRPPGENYRPPQGNGNKGWIKRHFMGTIATNTILSYRPEEISSVVMPPGHGDFKYGWQYVQSRPFNFSDMVPPWPSSAYFGRYPLSKTMGDVYEPMVALPPSLLDIDPLWKFRNCSFYPPGTWDPPFALSALHPLAPTTAASPGPTIAPIDPPRTTKEPGMVLTTATPMGSDPKPTAEPVVLPPSQQPEDPKPQPQDPVDPPPQQRPPPPPTAVITLDPSLTLTATINNPTPTPPKGSPSNPSDPSGPSDPASPADPADPAVPKPPIINIGNTQIQAGSPALTISSHILSADPSGNLIIDGTNTIPLPTPKPIDASPNSLPQSINHIVIPLPNNPSITASPATNGGIVIDGTTITPGGSAITISGHTLSVAAGGGVVIDGSTTPLAALPTAKPIESGVVTIGGQVYNISAISGVAIVDGTTIYIGGQATVGGTVVSLGGDGLVIGGSVTVDITKQTALSTGGSGGSQETGRAANSATGNRSGLLMMIVGIIVGLGGSVCI